MAQSSAGSHFTYDDQFTPARSRRNRKNRRPTQPPSPPLLFHSAAEELARTHWLSAAKQTLRDALEDAFSSSHVAPDVLCLGLGSPASSRDARAQLAFLIAVCDDLSIDRAKVSVFDPVFADPDLQLLAQLRLTCLPENHEARYALRSHTIVFMPHCDLHLYENILRANWSIDRLPNLLLIANRLSDYADSTPSRKLAAERPCVARLVPYLTSRPLQPCALYPTAFNSTALQFVTRATLAHVSEPERGPDVNTHRSDNHNHNSGSSSSWWALPDPPSAPGSSPRPSPATKDALAPPALLLLQQDGHQTPGSPGSTTTPSTTTDIGAAPGESRGSPEDEP